MSEDLNFVRYYILDDKGDPVQATRTAWMNWIEADHEATRIIDKTTISPQIWVSTVFIGFNHDFLHQKPLIFETMIFRNNHGEECWRYSTRAEAIDGHARAVKLAKIEHAEDES